jgi:hypothetical protein
MDVHLHISHHVQQVVIGVLWVPISHRLDTVAHVLLLNCGFHLCESPEAGEVPQHDTQGVLDASHANWYDLLTPGDPSAAI